MKGIPFKAPVEVIVCPDCSEGWIESGVEIDPDDNAYCNSCDMYSHINMWENHWRHWKCYECSSMFVAKDEADNCCGGGR